MFLLLFAGFSFGLLWLCLFLFSVLLVGSPLRYLFTCVRFWCSPRVLLVFLWEAWVFGFLLAPWLFGPFFFPWLTCACPFVLGVFLCFGGCLCYLFGCAICFLVTPLVFPFAFDTWLGSCSFVCLVVVWLLAWWFGVLGFGLAGFGFTTCLAQEKGAREDMKREDKTKFHTRELCWHKSSLNWCACIVHSQSFVRFCLAQDTFHPDALRREIREKKPGPRPMGQLKGSGNL